MEQQPKRLCWEQAEERRCRDEGQLQADTSNQKGESSADHRGAQGQPPGGGRGLAVGIPNRLRTPLVLLAVRGVADEDSFPHVALKAAEKTEHRATPTTTTLSTAGKSTAVHSLPG